MTRLLDVMEDYLVWKQYKYLRLDGHTSGGDRGALIEQFNNPDSPYFIFLLSIRAGGVGVNLQAADTVIIFDTDWNPQVDLQAQARAHRIGQKRDVLVLRLETVQTVEEQVRASAEHKLGVANQSITAGFFDNNTSAEDRREYLESLLRECKKEEVAPVLDDDSLNDIIARSESEIDIFEAVDKQRHAEEMSAWQNLFGVKSSDNKCKQIPLLPSRLLTEEDLKSFYEVMKISAAPTSTVLPDAGVKRKRGNLGGPDTQHYGRGKRAREVRSYEEQWTEEEFDRMCQAESPGSLTMEEEVTGKTLLMATQSMTTVMGEKQAPSVLQLPTHPSVEPSVPPKIEATSQSSPHPLVLQNIQPNPQLLALQNYVATPPSKRGRGRPKRVLVASPPVLPVVPSSEPSVSVKAEESCKVETTPVGVGPGLDIFASTDVDVKELQSSSPNPISVDVIPPSILPAAPSFGRGRGRGRKLQTSREAPASRRKGKTGSTALQAVPIISSPSVTVTAPIEIQGQLTSSASFTTSSSSASVPIIKEDVCVEPKPASPAPSNVDVMSQEVTTKGSSVSGPITIRPVPVASVPQPDRGSVPASIPQTTHTQPAIPSIPLTTPGKRRGRGRGRGRGREQTAKTQEETPKLRRRRREPVAPTAPGQDSAIAEPPSKRTRASIGRSDSIRGERDIEFVNASHSAARDIQVPSTNEQVIKGSAIDTNTSKFQDPSEELYGNEKSEKDYASEILPSKLNAPEETQLASTLDLISRESNSLVSSPGNKSAVKSAEPDDKKELDNEPCRDSSSISIPLPSQSDNNPKTSEDSWDPIEINNKSAVVENDLDSALTEAAKTVGEMSDDEGIIVSNKKPTIDDFPVSKNLLKGAGASKDPNSLTLLSATSCFQATSAVELMPVPVVKDMAESPCQKEGDQLVGSSDDCHLNESSSGLVKSSEGATCDECERVTVNVSVSTVEHCFGNSATATSTVLEHVMNEPNIVSVPSNAEVDPKMTLDSPEACCHASGDLDSVPALSPQATEEEDISDSTAEKVSKGSVTDPSSCEDRLMVHLQQQENKENEASALSVPVPISLASCEYSTPKTDNTEDCENSKDPETSEESRSLLKTSSNTFKMEKNLIVSAEAAGISGNGDNKVTSSTNEDEISADISSKSVAVLYGSEDPMPLPFQNVENLSPPTREMEGPENATLEIVKDADNESGNSLVIETEVHATPVEVHPVGPARDICNLLQNLGEQTEEPPEVELQSISCVPEESEKVKEVDLRENLNQTVERDDSLSSSLSVNNALEILAGPRNAMSEIVKDPDESGNSLVVETEVHATLLEVHPVGPGRDICNLLQNSGERETGDALENFEVEQQSTSSMTEESEKVKEAALRENLNQTGERDDSLSSSLGVNNALEKSAVEMLPSENKESKEADRTLIDDDNPVAAGVKEDEKVVESSTTPTLI